MDLQTEIATLQENSEINLVAFNHSGKILASGSNDNEIKLWNIEFKFEICRL